MKIKFIDQQYQTDAVNAIVDIFEGSTIKDSPFTIDISKGINSLHDSILEGEGITYELGHGNRLMLSNQELLENVRKIQEKNGILKSNSLKDKNFTIEMETGTGKTYVYTKTILELHKKYGFTKFIIVVPSVAIREGVYKSFQITEDHFKMKYDNEVYNYFIYDSNKLTQIQSFATSTNIEVMIINIDSFRRSFTDPTRETTANLIHRATDKLSGNKPIDLISSTNPIVIIDEPQSVDNTPKAKEAIKSLNPMCTLRYSATHRDVYNLMYRLTPVDAYQQNLVKHIEVSSITSDEGIASPYIKLLSTNTKSGYSARVEINSLKNDGSVGKSTVTVKPGDDLWEKSNYVDYYKDKNYIVDDIYVYDNEEYIYFSNTIRLVKGEQVGGVNDDAIKRAQINETIRLHLEKEEKYIKKGIKVLSLFFIDRVDKYRRYDDDGNQILGDYGVWFEEEYAKLINGRFKHLKEEFKDSISFIPNDIHDGYFSVDRLGRASDTKGNTISDESTYELIMKNKERLLSFKEPVRFIFSHSALKEGWDNPNVFQVCTLVETKDTMTKRQKIGRGLRIAVNQDGERVNNHRYNILSVIANESYKDFATGLQRELEKEAGYKFGIVDEISFSGLKIINLDGTEQNLTQEQSKNIFKYLKEKEYLKSNNEITEKFKNDLKHNLIELPEEYSDFKEVIISRIEHLSKSIEIKDANDKIKINLNKEIYLSEEFKNMWNRIKGKTIYSVNINMEEFIKESVEFIKTMPRIVPERIYRERSKINIKTAGVLKEGSSRHGIVGDLSEYDNISYPDIIRRLQDSTKLLRKTIIEILAESERISEFYENPEQFLRQVSNILNQVKRSKLSDGLKYYKTDEYYIQSEIFDDSEFYGYKNKNILDISDIPSEENKNIYDHVVFDSNIERQFAEDAQQDEDVILYGKLPSKFIIDTPYGGYNPDWIVVIQTQSEDKLYFVAETKGSVSVDDLRQAELSKILAGRKHFEVLDSEIKYEVISSLKDLKK